MVGRPGVPAVRVDRDSGLMAKTWTCRRSANGERCGHLNSARFQKCQACGKPRQRSKPPAHRAILDLSYEVFVRIGGKGDVCNICGAPPKPGRRLNRDHSHDGDGYARGVLCWRHNRGLEMFGDDPALLRGAADYLERAQRRVDDDPDHPVTLARFRGVGGSA